MDLQGFIDLFAENFDRSGELGASVCIRRNGEEVLHLADGYRDREKTFPWTKETPVLIWSATKALSSACLIHAACEHGVELDRKVVDLWPEYGQNGKAETTLLHVLTHQAGQPALRDLSISILDHERCRRSARSAGAVLEARCGARLPSKNLWISCRRTGSANYPRHTDWCLFPPHIR